VKSDDLQASRDMLLADKDFYDRQIYQAVNDVSKQICILLITVMQTFTKFEDTFFKVPDLRGNDAIVYSQHGTLYIPNCINISTFYVYKNISVCLEDIPVYFYLNSIQRQAYLTRDGILRSTSRVIHCRDTDRFIQLKDMNIVVVRKNMVVSLSNKNELLVTKIDFSNENVDSINFVHAQTVFATPDVIMQMQDFSTLQDSNTPLFISGSTTVKKDIIDEVFDKIYDWYEEYRKTFVAILTFILLLIFGIIILVILTCNRCCIFRNLKQCLLPKNKI